MIYKEYGFEDLSPLVSASQGQGQLFAPQPIF